MKKSLIAVVVVVVVLSTSGCSSSPTSSALPAADAGAQLSCEHFRNVVRDAAAGILTPAEERTKIQEVYDSARASSDAGIADNAQAMLASITTGDGSNFGNAGKAFLNACKRIGQ